MSARPVPEPHAHDGASKTVAVLAWAHTASHRRALVERLEQEPMIEAHGAAPTAAMVIKRALLHQVDVVLIHQDIPAEEVDAVRAGIAERGMRLRLVHAPDGLQNLGRVLLRHSVKMPPLASVRPSASRAPVAPAAPIPGGGRGNGRIPERATEVVCISTSTGGPKALVRVLSALPAEFPLPILVMQHIPEGFATQLAETLSSHARLPVRVAVDGELVEPGTIWLAPGDYHMGVVRDRTRIRLRLDQGPKINNCRPAGDFLLGDAVQVWGGAVLSVVLTGMGRDGEQGSYAVREAGGMVIAQDEATSVVWGMPGAVARAQLAHQILPLDEIAHAIVRRARRPSDSTVSTAPACEADERIAL